MTMQKITPHLWFDKEAKEAAEFYCSFIPDSRVTSATTLRDTPSGDADLVSFVLVGQPFTAISAGPLFKFNPSVSFHLKYSSAAEVDTAWKALSEGGKVRMPLDKYPFSERYGWIEDRYGLSWQVIMMPESAMKQRITPVLMFANRAYGKAEEVINFYSSVFVSQEKPTVLARYEKNEEPDKQGTVKYAAFTLNGQEFGAMDSARTLEANFNEAISFTVPCDDQKEIDYYWEQLSADPNAEQCGWLKDKYGLSWQIVPAAMAKFMNGDEEQRTRVTQAFLKMKKFDIATLQKTYDGE